MENHLHRVQHDIILTSLLKQCVCEAEFTDKKLLLNFKLTNFLERMHCIYIIKLNLLHVYSDKSKSSVSVAVQFKFSVKTGSQAIHCLLLNAFLHYVSKSWSTYSTLHPNCFGEPALPRK